MIDRIKYYLKNLFNRDKENIEIKNTCSSCVHWASEEMNNVPTLYNDERKFCNIHKNYNRPNHSCEFYKEELFEATEDSTQTEEINIELNQELEFDKNSINNDI